jgi:hypothetical protein
MSLSCHDEWKNYVEVVKSSSVRCFKVIVEKGCTPKMVAMVDNVDEPVNNLTQEEQLQTAVVEEVEAGALNDDFDEVRFDEDDGIGDGIDDISAGSEDDKFDFSSAGEDDLTSGATTSDDVVEDEYRIEPSSDNESDRCEEGFADTIRVPADGSLRMEYNDIELRQLKAVHVEVPSVPNLLDISKVDQAICDTGLSLLGDELADSEEVHIKKGMLFDTLEHLKFFLMDYAVRFHRPYYVRHSDKNKRYTVHCKNGCGWRLWARWQRNEKWKISNVRQPHTC